MTNPFSGIISVGFKELFTNAIDALLEEGACSFPCKFFYGDTKFDDCPNCVGGRIYQAGGPVPFRQGQICPYCGGNNRIPIESSEIIYLCVIWDYNKWIQLNNTKNLSPNNLNSPKGVAQTISSISTLPQIKKAKYVLLDTNIDNYEHHKFQIFGEPEPCGFGENSYVMALWERIS